MSYDKSNLQPATVASYIVSYLCIMFKRACQQSAFKILARSVSAEEPLSEKIVLKLLISQHNQMLTLLNIAMCDTDTHNIQ